jgi:ATP-binding cassette subfamily B protein
MQVRYNLPRIDVTAVRNIFRRFAPLLKPYRGRLIFAALAMLGTTLLSLARPWPIKVVLDAVLMPGKKAPTTLLFVPIQNLTAYQAITAAAVAVIIIAVLEGMLRYAHTILSKIIGHKLVGAIRLELFSHVQRLPLSYHDYRETGDLLTRMTDDITLVEDLMVNTIVSALSQSLLIVGMISIMFWLDWQLGLMMIAVMPLFLLVAFRFSVKIRSSAKKQRETYGKIVASMQESLAGISHIKNYSQEKTREKLIGQSLSRDVKANVRTARLTAHYERMVEIIVAIGTAGILWLGAVKAYRGQISAGDLMVFLSYLRSAYRPIKAMANRTANVAKAVVRGEKLLEILEMRPEVADDDTGRSAADIKGDIRFENVNFSYVHGRPTLTDFTCRMPGGKTTVILGTTGAGKSTVAKLILRLYDYQSGKLFMDGRDIQEFNVRSLRKRIAPLAQETFLFRTSIEENIGFGRRHATNEEIVLASERAGIHGFISGLPEGYNTLVGEGGVTLSGGQRQRISCARAILRGSNIMIFDEPATGLDVHSEQATKNMLAEMRIGRTMILITHRLHFLEMADWVILVSDGRVVEEGTPSELYDRQGAYYHFICGHKTFDSGSAESASKFNQQPS